VSGQACLSAEECLDFVARAASAPTTERIHRHIATCSSCRTVLAEAARRDTSASEPPQALSTLAVGERIADRYEVRRFIAAGGMGEVYEVFDVALSETLALKTLALTAVDQAAAAERFLSEVRLARKVTHPNVCRILEFGIHRRQGRATELVPFLTMELLQGETLASFLRGRGPLDTATTVGILRGVLGGLSAIHAAGIVHRDLKSDNVFITPDGAGTPRAVVMDFGLARPLTSAEASRGSSESAVIGTLAYMAPEQLEGKPATTLSDIYAVGVIAFEALTGRLPFVADAPFAAAAKKLSEPAPRPSAVARGLHAGWDELLLHCLDRAPQRRPPDVGAVTAALDRLGEGNAPRRRTAMLAAAAAAATVLGIVGLSQRGAPPGPAAPASVAAPAPAPATAALAAARAPQPPPAATPAAVEQSAPAPHEAGAPRRKTGKNVAHATPAPHDEPAPIDRPNPEPPTTAATPEAKKLRHPDDLINPFRSAPFRAAP
jgi:tRNA A-37 threonylcarbamoyl transferase component Bud32